MSRTQEIFERLRELNLPSEAWALFAELENIKTMHSATEAAAGYRAGVDDAEAERKRKDRDRKKEASRKFQETPIISLDINSEGGVGETIQENPRTILESLLDSDRAKAVVEHRKKIKKPLTGHAAKLLKAELSKAPDPNAAADKMIARGWQGFEVDWLKNNKDPPNVLAYKPRPAPKTWKEQQAEKQTK